MPAVDAASVSLHFQTTITSAGTSITFNAITYHNGDSASFNTGTSYSATANPDTGYAFTGWGTILSNSSCISINQLTILVNNTHPPLAYTYTCDSTPYPSPCTATSFYSVTFNLHFSNEYIFFYLRGTSAATPPLMVIIIAILVAPVLLLLRKRRFWLRYVRTSLK